MASRTTRTIQHVLPPENVLDVARHDPCDILQVFVELVDVALGARVLILAFRLLNVGVWSGSRVVVVW